LATNNDIFPPVRIVYQGNDGIAKFISPLLNNAVHLETGEYLPLFGTEDPPEGYRRITVDEIAVYTLVQSGYPADTPYDIIPVETIDRTYRDALEYDDGN